MASLEKSAEIPDFEARITSEEVKRGFSDFVYINGAIEGLRVEDESATIQRLEESQQLPSRDRTAYDLGVKAGRLYADFARGKKRFYDAPVDEVLMQLNDGRAPIPEENTEKYLDK